MHPADIRATMAEIVSGSMPETVELLRLAEQASSLIASAPQLMAAENDGRRAEIAGDIARQSRLLAAGLNRLRGLDPSLNDGLKWRTPPWTNSSMRSIKRSLVE